MTRGAYTFTEIGNPYTLDPELDPCGKRINVENDPCGLWWAHSGPCIRRSCCENYGKEDPRSAEAKRMCPASCTDRRDHTTSNCDMVEGHPGAHYDQRTGAEWTDDLTKEARTSEAKERKCSSCGLPLTSCQCAGVRTNEACPTCGRRG